MWLLPLLLIGAIVIAAASRSPRGVPTSHQLAAAPGPPGPISVLGEFLRVGQVPPPPVILCAIAEAEAIGRDDLASDIVRAFVEPVVHQHAMMVARPAHPYYTRAPMPAPSYERGSPAPYERGSCALPASPRSAAPISPPARRPATDEEIRAMLNADPERFVAMAARGVIDVEPPPAIAPPVVVPIAQPPGEVSAPAPGSPLAGVPDDAWRGFVALLEREAPTFSSSRHVGQYRQRRERLAELGIDPCVILGSPHAQRAALDADLVDAHRHAEAGDLLAEHLGRPIVVPGREGSTPITLSGLLGVIQCAGLEGAVGWLENASDRKRFPHTTQAFLRANGVF